MAVAGGGRMRNQRRTRTNSGPSENRTASATSGATWEPPAHPQAASPLPLGPFRYTGRVDGRRHRHTSCGVVASWGQGLGEVGETRGAVLAPQVGSTLEAVHPGSSEVAQSGPVVVPPR